MGDLICWIEHHQGTAAWVQAIASVFAIWWAGKSAIRLQKSIIRNQRMIRTEAVHAIIDCARAQVSNTNRLLGSRAGLEAAFEGRLPLDRGSLSELVTFVSAIPLHEMESDLLVREVLIAVGTIRQYRSTIEDAINRYRRLDANAINEFLSVIREMEDAIKKSVEVIAGELKTLKNRPIR